MQCSVKHWLPISVFKGPHAREAAERRAAAQQGEAARRAEAQGHWLAHVRGRGLSGVGMVFTP